MMISYQWDSQKRMITLREKLKLKGFSVWMDVEKMGKMIRDRSVRSVVDSNYAVKERTYRRPSQFGGSCTGWKNLMYRQERFKIMC